MKQGSKRNDNNVLSLSNIYIFEIYYLLYVSVYRTLLLFIELLENIRVREKYSCISNKAFIIPQYLPTIPDSHIVEMHDFALNPR